MADRPMTVLHILEAQGWRFAKRGDKSLPVCPKHYK
jgi:hypothetical protein